MLSDGDCKIAEERPPSVVVDPRRPEGDIVISASVGQGGRNIADDVFKIQYGLDQVPPIDGGPNPPLKIDGLCGPKTIGAIRAFQQKHFGWAGCDGRIDPGKQTLRMLNEKRQRWIQPYLPLNPATDGWLLASLLRHVPYTRMCVIAALGKISRVRLNLPNFSPIPEDPMALINRHFHLSGSTNVQRDLALMSNMYNFMLEVLNRPEAYITLDTNDEGEGISTVAIARNGGFHDKADETGKIKLRRGAYFASETQDFAAFVFIHELRHFVELFKALNGGHYGKGWYTDDGMKDLPPEQTVLNCDTYAGFALEAQNGDMQRPGWLKSTQFR